MTEHKHDWRMFDWWAECRCGAILVIERRKPKIRADNNYSVKLDGDSV